MNTFGKGDSAFSQKRKAPHPGGSAIQTSRNYKSPLRLVLIISLCVFFGETFVMVVLSFLPAWQTWFEALFDATVLIILLSPVLFFFVYRPFVQHLKERNTAQQQRHDLGERVKELNCLYGISDFIEKHEYSLEKILVGTVNLIPVSWQYPEITCAKIVADDHRYQTENFRETEWNQTSNIVVKGQTIGAVEVFYLAEKPQIDEGPFLKEERSLIDAIASRLGRIIERIQAEEVLKQESGVNAALSELYEPLISLSASIRDMAHTVMEKAKSLTGSEHGYVGSIDPASGDMVVHTFTEMLKRQCQLTGENRRIVFPPEKDGRYPNLWGHSLNTLKSFYYNSPATHEASRGVPDEHIPVHRFLSVPVMLGEDLVGQIALANKDRDYTEQDLAAICRVAEFYALAIQRHRAKEALQTAKNELEKQVEERTKKLKTANIKLSKEVDDRKLVELRLVNTKTMLQAVFDGILDPLILIDKKCRVKIINKVAAKYYGLDNPGDIIGKYCYDALRGRLEPCDGCEIPEAVMNDRSLTFERRGIMDPARLEQVVIYPVKAKADQVGDAIIRITDITEAKQLERQVIQSEKMASLGVLVSSIAHEINNPNTLFHSISPF